MEKILQFKTNIHCGSCIRAVRGFLAEVPHVTHWEVDTENPDKILTVRGTEELTAEKVIAAVEEAGYEAEVVGSGQ